MKLRVKGMDDFQVRDGIERLFLRLRRQGYALGVAEYQAALDAVGAGFAIDEMAFLAMVQTLWCQNRSQQSQLVPIWELLQQEIQNQRDKDDLFKDRPDRDGVEDLTSLPDLPKPERSQPIEQREEDAQTEMQSLPVQAPRLDAIDPDDLLSLQSYFPVSRRSMAYGWRFLRRLVADGALVLLDVAATVQRVTEQGFYLAPVYVRFVCDEQRN